MGVLPHGVGVLPTYGARRTFLVKNINVVLNLQYHIFYQENICIAKIWRAFDYKSISKSFIHWLLRYEPRFLGWASCPMSPYPVNSPHKGQWRGALMFTLICDRINGWVNNRQAGDLRRHRAHYDVIVMDNDKPRLLSCHFITMVLVYTDMICCPITYTRYIPYVLIRHSMRYD